MRNKVVKFALVLVWLVTLPAYARADERPMIAFVLDQGMQNGIIENRDLGGLERALAAIHAFDGKYKTFAFFSPLTAKTDRLKQVLQVTARSKVAFFLDVYSSDVMAIGNITTLARSDAAPSQALAISLDGIRRIKADPLIGPYFAGIRFHEIGAIDFTVKHCMDHRSGPDRVNWCDHFSSNLRQRNILDIQRIRPFFEFARQQHMLILWEDWKWDLGTQDQQQQLAQLIGSGRYKNSLLLQYANNLPDEAARGDDQDWRNWLAHYQPEVGKTILGLGLSDQSWTCRNQKACPVNVITRWVGRALEARTTMVAFEPSFYFFHLPNEDKPKGYPTSPQWRTQSGIPSDALKEVAQTLGVSIK